MSSKKMLRMTLILIGVLILALGGYFLVDFIARQEEDAVKAEEASLHLFEFDPNSIVKVTLDTSEGHFEMEMQTEGWVLTETDYPHEFQLNTSYVSTVCSYMCELTAEKKFVDTDEQDLSNFGLADPVVLTCTDSKGTDYTLHVGAASPTQEYFYVQKPGEETVFGVPYDRGAVFTGSVAYLRNSYLVQAFDVNIREISLETPDAVVFDLVNESGYWEMLAPLKDAQVDAAQVKSLITSLVRLELTSYLEMVDENTNFQAYGLDKPNYTLTVKQVDGTVSTMDFSAIDENDTYVYVHYRENGEIAALSTSISGFLKTSTSELLESRIHYVDFAQAASVDVVADDLQFRMEMDAASGTYKLDDVDITALGDSAVSTFRSLFDTMSHLSFDSLDLEASVTEQEPTFTFLYTMQDGSQTEVSLIPFGDNTYWALKDGEYTGMIIRRRALSGNMGVLTFYEKMMDTIAEANRTDS